jgi:hypothetical protein
VDKIVGINVNGCAAAVQPGMIIGVYSSHARDPRVERYRFTICSGHSGVDNIECAALVKKGCTVKTTRTDSKIDVVIIIIMSHLYKELCDDDVTFFSLALRKSSLPAMLSLESPYCVAHIKPCFHAVVVNTRRYD